MKINCFHRPDCQGFTLMELLLVIAIIGILVATVYVSLGGQRQRARAHSALKSVSSALPYAVECYMKGAGPQQTAAGGGNICDDTAVVNMAWPSLPSGCTYSANGSIVNDTEVAQCNGGGTGLDIYCNAGSSGRCWIQ